jgi:hypothetical protein
MRRHSTPLKLSQPLNLLHTSYRSSLKLLSTLSFIPASKRPCSLAFLYPKSWRQHGARKSYSPRSSGEQLHPSSFQLKQDGLFFLFASVKVDMLSLKTSFSYAAAVQGLGGGGGGGNVGDGGPGALLTQHWMSVFPGQNPEENVPPEQPLFLTLRQYPDPLLGTLQFIFTQHCHWKSVRFQYTYIYDTSVPEHPLGPSGRGR